MITNLGRLLDDGMTGLFFGLSRSNYSTNMLWKINREADYEVTTGLCPPFTFMFLLTHAHSQQKEFH